MNNIEYLFGSWTILIIIIPIITTLITIVLIIAIFEINRNIKDIRNYLIRNDHEINERLEPREDWIYE